MTSQDARVLGLLALAVLINMADRGNLSTVAPVLSRELGLTNTELGWLFSAFFWIYAPGQLLAGSLAERFSVKGVIAAGFFLWAAATFCTGLAHGFTAVLVLRLLLGLGESALFPAASKLLATRTQETQRGKANAIFLIGLSVGPAIGTLAGGAILAAFGWRPVFLVFGLLSLLWLWPWLATPMPPASTAAEPGPAYADIVRQRPAWGMAVGHFCANYMGYFLLTWLPSFLVNDRHLSLQGMGWAGGTIYASEALNAIFWATVADRWIARGGSVNRVRKTMLITGTLAIAVFMLAAATAPTVLAIPYLVLAAAGRGMQLPNIYAVAQSFAGPRASGRWMGMENFLANLAGLLAPVLTGKVVDLTGSYVWGFVLVAAFSVLGAVSWWWAIGEIKPIVWASQQSAT